MRWPKQAVAQAIAQILRNAVQASPASDKASCAARVADTGVIIEVTDTGQGMDREILARVGEPFFSTRTDGTGLGLFIARSLVDHLGGRIDMRSARGQGTTVQLWLPKEVRG